MYSPNRVTLSGIKSEYLDGTVTMGEAIDQLLRALLARFAPKRVPMTPIMRDISPFLIEPLVTFPVRRNNAAFLKAHCRFLRSQFLHLLRLPENNLGQRNRHLSPPA